MDQGMKEIGFTPSSFDPCLYYRGSIVFLVYIDDCIIFGPDSLLIDAVVADLQACSHRFTVDDQGDIGDFLGIQVTRFSDGSIQLTQLQLIDAIIKDLHPQNGSNMKKTPAVPNNPDKDATEYLEKPMHSSQCVMCTVKTSGSCMEQIHGPGHERNWFHAEFLRSMPVLSWQYRLPCLY